MRENMEKKSIHVALGGVLTALSLLLMYLAALLPTGQLGMVALAGLVPAAAVITGGFATGFLCYGATSILSLLLLPGKGCALLYTLLLGLYPVLKGLIERIRKLALELVLKLVFFNLVLTVLWFAFSALVLPMLPERLSGAGWYYAVGNGAFLLYDYGVSKLISAYGPRLRQAVRRR